MKESSSQNYEHNLAQLQSVVERLELETLGLEESLDLFELGMSLAAQCDGQLQAVEERVKVLVSGQESLNSRGILPMEALALGETVPEGFDNDE